MIRKPHAILLEGLKVLAKDEDVAGVAILLGKGADPATATDWEGHINSKAGVPDRITLREIRMLLDR